MHREPPEAAIPRGATGRACSGSRFDGKAGAWLQVSETLAPRPEQQRRDASYLPSASSADLGGDERRSRSLVRVAESLTGTFASAATKLDRRRSVADAAVTACAAALEAGRLDAPRAPERQPFAGYGLGAVAHPSRPAATHHRRREPLAVLDGRGRRATDQCSEPGCIVTLFHESCIYPRERLLKPCKLAGASRAAAGRQRDPARQAVCGTRAMLFV